MGEGMEKTVFVTVGTTKFDKLVSKLTEERTLLALCEKGFKNLIIQIGNGSIIPDVRYNGMNISYYRFKDSIAEDISNADLVISHAGAGSCLEVLEARKPLIVVINENLADNHQFELAKKLSTDKHLYACYCLTLVDAIKKMEFSQLKNFPLPEPHTFSRYLDNLMGFKE